MNSAQEAYNSIRYQGNLGIREGQAVGLAYGRPGGEGHMVMAVRDSGYVGNNDANGAYRRSDGVYVTDHQQDPPTRAAFPPADYQDGQPIYVFYRSGMVSQADEDLQAQAELVGSRAKAIQQLDGVRVDSNLGLDGRQAVRVDVLDGDKGKDEDELRK